MRRDIDPLSSPEGAGDHQWSRGRMRDGGKFTLRKVIRAGTRCQRVSASQIAGEPEYRVGTHVPSIRRRIDGHPGLEHPEAKTGDEVGVPFG